MSVHFCIEFPLAAVVDAFVGSLVGFLYGLPSGLSIDCKMFSPRRFWLFFRWLIFILILSHQYKGCVHLLKAGVFPISKKICVCPLVDSFCPKWMYSKKNAMKALADWINAPTRFMVIV
jgi:hypothetical protein